MPSNWITHETGIYEAKDRNRDKPFLWRQTIRGKKHSVAYQTLEAAKAAKQSKLDQVKAYGDMAVRFEEKDWRELEEARSLLPEDVSIVDAAREYVERHGNGRGRPIGQCVSEFIGHQVDRGNSSRHIRSLRSRVGYLARAFDGQLVGGINRQMLMELLQKMKETLKPRTIRNYRNDWANFFGYLVETKEITSNPTDEITRRLLPKVKTSSEKHPLELWQVAAVLALCEEKYPKLAYWMALQFFVGFREAEASRFRHEWVQPEMRRVVIPGWYEEGGELKRGTKTEDTWVIDKVPENFWAWHAKYGRPSGHVDCPGDGKGLNWQHSVSKSIYRAGILERWPHNAKRDSFCTYHLSAFRDQAQTALILKHSNVTTLWKSYMGTLRTEQEGRAYFQIYPGSELVKPIS